LLKRGLLKLGKFGIPPRRHRRVPLGMRENRELKRLQDELAGAKVVELALT
jgi:hypothetical protein